jgi:hypothetical protein
MFCRVKAQKPGDAFPVKDAYHYALPNGLKDGTLVTLLSFDHGYWTVEAGRQQFKVFMTAINSGMEYLLNGRWLPADDPRVIAELKRNQSQPI